MGIFLSFFVFLMLLLSTNASAQINMTLSSVPVPNCSNAMRERVFPKAKKPTPSAAQRSINQNQNKFAMPSNGLIDGKITPRPNGMKSIMIYIKDPQEK